MKLASRFGLSLCALLALASGLAQAIPSATPAGISEIPPWQVAAWDDDDDDHDDDDHDDDDDDDDDHDDD